MRARFPITWTHPRPWSGVIGSCVVRPVMATPLGAVAAIAGGREVWGFPKHPDPADAAIPVYPNDETVTFEGFASGPQGVFALKFKRPESIEGPRQRFLWTCRTGEDTCITPSASILPKRLLWRNRRATDRPLLRP